MVAFSAEAANEPDGITQPARFKRARQTGIKFASMYPVGFFDRAILASRSYSCRRLQYSGNFL
jgi:hypothetical protein